MKWMMLFALGWSASAAAQTAQLSVKGAVELRIAVIAADLSVTVGARDKVTVRVVAGDCPGALALTQHGDRVELGKQGGPFTDGKLAIELPPGSSADLESTSGDVEVLDLGGRVKVRAISGDVKVRGAASAELTLVSGDARLSEIHGEVRVRTVSGDAHVEQKCGASSQLHFASTSGDLEWHGDCAAGCRLETRTTSGDVKLVPGGSSSFEVAFDSRSGSLNDTLKLESVPAGRGKRARLGKGEGLVECRSFSGDVTLARN